MSLLVDNPILNSPFEEPTRHWAYEEGQPVLKEGRRPAGYYLKARTRGPQMALLEEAFIPLELVSTIRERVKVWRAWSFRSYPFCLAVSQPPEITEVVSCLQGKALRRSRSIRRRWAPLWRAVNHHQGMGKLSL